MAGAMLNFKDYGLFADIFGPRWNYYLRDIVASIPIPLVFGKGSFESGVAAKMLAEYAADPFPYLGPETKKKMMEPSRMMWRKFEELTFDGPATAHWQTVRPDEADNIDVGLVTETDFQDDLFEISNNPF